MKINLILISWQYKMSFYAICKFYLFSFFYAFHNVILNLLHHSLFKFRIQERDFIPRSGAFCLLPEKNNRTEIFFVYKKINLAVEAELYREETNLIKISSIAPTLCSREKGILSFSLSLEYTSSKSNLGSTAGLPRESSGQIILVDVTKTSRLRFVR